LAAIAAWTIWTHVYSTWWLQWPMPLFILIHGSIILFYL